MKAWPHDEARRSCSARHAVHRNDDAHEVTTVGVPGCVVLGHQLVIGGPSTGAIRAGAASLRSTEPGLQEHFGAEDDGAVIRQVEELRLSRAVAPKHLEQLFPPPGESGGMGTAECEARHEV